MADERERRTLVETRRGACIIFNIYRDNSLAHTWMYAFHAMAFGLNSNITNTFHEQGPADTAYLGGCIPIDVELGPRGRALGKVEVYVRMNVTHKGQARDPCPDLTLLATFFFRHLMEPSGVLAPIRRIETSYLRLPRVALFFWSHSRRACRRTYYLYPKARPNSKQVNRRRVGRRSLASREWLP